MRFYHFTLAFLAKIQIYFEVEWRIYTSVVYTISRPDTDMFSAKPLSKPSTVDCELGHWEQISNQNTTILLQRIILKM